MQKPDLREFKKRREKALTEFDAELAQMAATIFSLIPKDFSKGYTDREFREFKTWVANLVERGELRLQATDLTGYGWSNVNHVVRDIRKLRIAWYGIINIRIDATDNFPEIIFSLA